MLTKRIKGSIYKNSYLNRLGGIPASYRGMFSVSQSALKTTGSGNKPDAKISIKTVKDDTPLHAAIRSGKSPDEIGALIKSIGIKQATKMAKVTNANGELPYDVIPEKDFYKISDMLVPLMSAHDLRPFSEPLSVDEVIKQYYPNITTEFCENVEMTCSAINTIRKTIKFCFTHPDRNNESRGSHSYALSAVLKVRRELDEELIQVNPYAFFTKTINVIQRHQAGACDEMAHYGIAHIVSEQKKNKRQFLIEAFGITDGDHLVGVLDRPFDSSPKKLKNWKHSTLIWDAWAGNIIRATSQDDLKTNLSAFRQIELIDGKIINIATPFNPSYHSFKQHLTVDNHSEKMGNTISQDEHTRLRI